MTEAERIPGTAWYGLAAAIAVVATVAAIGTGVWLFLQYESAVTFLAPGRYTFEAKKAGSYLVWNDYRTVFQGRSFDESKHLPSGARISVIDTTNGRELPIASHSGTTSTTGTSESVAVAQFGVAQPGAYEVIVQGEFPPRVMSVGRNRIFQLAGGIIGALALVFVGYSLALAIAGWVFLKRKDVEGTWLESHFRWQIRTFWYGLLWTLIGFVLAFVLVGFLVLMGVAAWVLYRAIRGWIQLEDGKPMYA